MSNLMNIQILHAGENVLSTELPIAVTFLTSLSQLYVQRCGLKMLPKWYALFHLFACTCIHMYHVCVCVFTFFSLKFYFFILL